MRRYAEYPELNGSIGKVIHVQRDANIFEFQCTGGKSRITILAPRIIRVQATQDDEYRRYESFATVGYSEPVPVEEEDHEDRKVISGEHFRLEVMLNQFVLRLLDSSRSVIQEDLPSGGVVWSGNGFECRKRMLGNEHFYGTGEKAHGLDKRGLHYEMWNTDNGDHDSKTDPLYQSIPFFIVFREGVAHGIFLDNTYRTELDFGLRNPSYYSFSAPNGPLDYYLFLGPRISDVVEEYTSLTGKPCFVPRWALGHQQSRFMEYRNEEDVLSVARNLRNHRIPCDTMVLDIGYMNECRVFTWDQKVFSDPKAFTSSLARMGFKVMTIIDPGVKLEDGYFMYDEGVRAGYFLAKENGSLYVGLVWAGETVFPDFSRSEVRAWFGSKYKMLADSGTSNSSWIDMNEPSNCIYDKLKDEYSMVDVVDCQGNPWEARLRNVYALGMAQAVFGGLKDAFPGKRPFILTRSGFAGYQRYAAMWTGDNHSTWDMLWLSIPMLLNLGLSGVPFCGADIGGFGGDTTPELLARWYQLGAFYPFSRNHSDIRSIRQEPWLFGEEAESVARDSVSFRYLLMRYFYSLAKTASTSGIPIMRPLVLEFQDDPATYTLDTQFMIGPFLMVAPVLEEGANSREVYFPRGRWYDLWTDTSIEGPQSLRVDAPFDRIPVYLRAGSIIPTGRIVQNTDEDQGDLVLWVYPGGTSTTAVFEDDGISDNEQSCETTFAQDSTDDRVVVTIDKRKGRWKPAERSLVLEVKGLTRPKSVEADGKRVLQEKTVAGLEKRSPSSFYDLAHKTLHMKLKDDGNSHKISLVL
ncbi:MAG: alpha-glucosidase [Candidatus Thorarchaeota archaeon]|nr:MAG: alpha-glucosidase [Candidatus Thorarchaeota archaeon]